MLLDADFRIRYASHTAGDGSDATGTPGLAWIKPEYHELVRSSAAQATATGLPQHYEIESQRPDGTSGWYSCWIADVSRGGDDTTYAITAHDITQSRRAAQAAVQTQELLENVAGNSSDYILVVDRDHRVELANRAPEGLTREAIVGSRVEDWLTPEEQARVGSLIDRAFRTGESGEYTTWAELPEGRRTFVTRVSAVEREGRVHRVTLIARDVTEERAAASTAREQASLLRAIVANAQAVIFLLDAEGNFLLSEGRQLEVLGLKPGEVVGRNALEMYAPYPEVLRSIQEPLAGREYRGVTPVGPFRFEVAASPYYDGDGRLAGVVGMGIDVTERERMAEQLQQASKLQAIGQLTGGVAHDFNNLLTVIMGNLELIRMAAEDAGSPPGLDRLAASGLEAAERGSALTHRLLAFSRKQPLQPTRVDLNRLIAGMEDLLRRTLGETIAVETVAAGGLWECEVDAAQLENAVLNLAINARDAMPAGGRLTIEAGNARLDPDYAEEHTEVRSGQYVQLAVTDTGCGIPPEMLERVFEPFFTTKGVGAGSGLGLSMVYGFTKQSGGHVKIYSEPGEGTTVKLYLPRASAGARAAEERTPVDDALTGAGETIVVVEDDPRVRALSVTLLTKLEYRPVAAATAAEGLALLDAHPDAALLFTDVVLPEGISGVELAAQATARRPGLKVLFTSGYTENAIIHHGRLDAGVELLEKPFTMKQLARRVREVLEG
ncbi:MAG: hybrid sensor histidine kinase/response regulator [Planctomycetota bacterium]